MQNPNGPSLAERFITAAAGSPPSPAQRSAMLDNAESVRVAAGHLELNTRPSREQSLALTHLEEALFWANKAVILHPLDAEES